MNSLNAIKTATLVVVLLLASAGASGQITITDSFENGRHGGWSFDGTYYNVNTSASTWDWLHFRVDGVQGQTPQFATPCEDSADRYRSYHRMVYSYDGQSWMHMDNGSKPGDSTYYFSNSSAFTQDSVYIAYWQPYTFSQTVQQMANLAGNPYVQNHGTVTTGAPSGGSYEGRDVYRYQVTDPAVADAYKENIVIVARQHGYESLGNYVNEGLTDWLLSSDPEAENLRRKAVVTVYPMANPDAVYNAWTREGKSKSGGTSDFNRDWFTGAPGHGGAASDSYEIDGLRDDIYDLTGGDGAWLIDMHSHAKGSMGGAWYWWQYPAGQETMDFMTDVRDYDLADDGDTCMEWPTSRGGSLTGTTAGAWGYHSFHGNGFTLEPIAAPYGTPRTTEQMRFIGEAIGEAFNNAVAEPTYFGGDANIDGRVDVGDLGILAGAWGATDADWFSGDFTGDGSVDVGDLGVLAGNWNQSVAPAGVPEPASAALLAVMGLAAIRRRR